ncbi:hypothetical protein N9A45_01550 [bacterium]|jgi:hypothetical protein|nr:hypothetical protein [bacterium]
MAAQPSGTDVTFRLDELHSHATDDPFLVAYVSHPSSPRVCTLTDPAECHFKLQDFESDELLLVIQMFCPRKNEEGKDITQYLGACVMDVSQCSAKTYHIAMRDASSRPALHTGQISFTFTELPHCRQSNVLLPAESRRLKGHRMQSSALTRQMYSAAEANLHWIKGFGAHGLGPITHGLRLVHSPYYVNFLGMTLPSGAFCMISTRDNSNVDDAIRSYKQRLTIALARNTMKETEFIDTVGHMMTSTIKSKHLRCLAVLADFLTLHTKMDIHYSPDVQLTPKPKGTERWSIPREPKSDGSTSFNGDCEDYAREIYQHCKELKEWIQPKLNASAIESAVAILHLYVPTIEQGAVDKDAHSQYITYEAAYRNHIWAALHPRDAWRTKCATTLNLEHLYADWSRKTCEKTLPMIHLEGTGEVYPVVTDRKPGYIAKMQQKQQFVENNYPDIAAADSPDISLQCDHSSDFYKFPIACMTDAFANQGVLDYTYVTGQQYGVTMYNWARGQYKFRPSCIHSAETMDNIRSILMVERPISAITTTSTIEKSHHIKDGYAVRYGQDIPFENVPDEAKLAVYNVGGQQWYELYFPLVGAAGSASSNEIESNVFLL